MAMREWEIAARAAKAAGEAALRFFGRVRAEMKADGSPVTEADRAAEAAALEVIRAEFPADSVLAEESGRSEGDARRLWVVDPLDGTRQFVRGWAGWGALVGFELDGRPAAGAMYLPVTGELFDGTNGRLSDCARIEDALVCIGHLPASLRGAEALVARAGNVRAPGDCGAVGLLLQGKCDLWLERDLAHWDLSALQALVERAGGRFTAWDGGPPVPARCAVAGNPRLHALALELLQGG
jgi:fructose-1,6-bisphosphatase/inositol monophosphatase family enzyme